MNKAVSLLTLFAVALLVSACSIFNPPNTPAAPTNVPEAPSQIQTAVAATLTAIAPAGGGTPVPPPTQGNATAAPVTAQPTAAPNLPTPTPGGEGNPPTVQVVAPANGAQVTANQTITVVALAADDSGISRVELYADNVLFGSQDAPNQPTTFQATFPWSSGAVGQHILAVEAYDLSNNASAPATVTVNVVANTTPPQVSILAPASPQRVSRPADWANWSASMADCPPAFESA